MTPSKKEFAENIGTGTSLVPENRLGKPVDLAYTKDLANEDEAGHCYGTARDRLLDFGKWHSLAGIASASFILVDEQGNPLARPAQQDDYVKIDIIGPGPTSGDGFDWVRIEQIGDGLVAGAAQSVGIRVRSCQNPQDKTGNAAHFFDQDATSTFLIQNTGKTVTASYHGRNEKPNTGAVPLADKLRNLAIASAALVGLSELQWKALLKGLLAQENSG